VSGVHLRSFAQCPHIKVATVASRWQSVEDLIGLGFESHTFHTRSGRLINCVIWPVRYLHDHTN